MTGEGTGAEVSSSVSAATNLIANLLIINDLLTEN
jgi:hypothetical protein